MKAFLATMAFLLCCSAAMAQVVSPIGTVTIQTPNGIGNCWVTSIGTLYCQ